MVGKRKVVTLSSKPEKKTQKKCGFVMPIADWDNCTSEHWSDVLEIFKFSVAGVGFDGRLVSEAQHVGVIQKQIVKNLYSNDVVVCDVSGRNPNVMLELGIRLAFNKPVVIVKDDETPYSFDTSPVQHLEYPRTLRHGAIQNFQAELAEKVSASIDDSTGQSFLDSFGDFKVAEIDLKQAPLDEVLLEEMKSLRADVARLRASRPSVGPVSRPASVLEKRDIDYIILTGNTKIRKSSELLEFIDKIESRGPVTGVVLDSDGDLEVRFKDKLDPNDREKAMKYIQDKLESVGLEAE